MKNKLKLPAVLLALCLLLSCMPFAALAEDAPANIVSIRTVDDLLELAQNCRLDSWSRNRTVLLEADLDLSGTDFTGIATFGGEFLGQGHTISGLVLQPEGSNQGLFRYVQEDARICDLTVKGAVSPEGSRSTVGGVAGVNAGLLQNVSFAGVVTGADAVGGIAGRNEVTGVIENCRVQGVVYGSHVIGGIAGENHGVVRSCENTAGINTTVQQNSVNVADITLDTLTGSETVTGSTDIGGIAGANSGVLRACVNRATVGYQHMGYNVGGIAGSQTGYVEGCVNFGDVYARKEGGGIAGQLEPSSTLIYGTDTLQTLSSQLNVLQSLIDRTAADAEAAGSELSSRLNDLQSQVSSARSAVNELLTQTFNGVSIGTQTVTTDLSSVLDDLEQRVKDTIETAGKPDLPELPDLPSGGGGEPEPSPEPLPEPDSAPDAGQQAESAPDSQTPHPRSAGHGAPGTGSGDTPADTSPLPTPDPDGSPQSPELPDLPEPSPLPSAELSFTLPQVEFSNQDSIIAARNSLSGSLEDLAQSVDALNRDDSGNASALGSDLRAITEQIGRISATLANAGNRSDSDVVMDISDEDTESDTEGKIYNCVNAGRVQADINAGGIAGAMAVENDLDPEDDITVSGELSANITYRSRAVVRGCSNRATVSAKKRCAGGIVGSMEMGCVLECVNTGLLDAADADYVGGIAGSSSKTVRACSAKCVVRGASYVGGIAGAGLNLQDNRVMVRLDASAECAGAVAGALRTQEDRLLSGPGGTDPAASGEGVTGNYFVPNETVPGAVDGISYEGRAQALSYGDFIALEGISDSFRTLTVRFVAEGTKDQVFEVEYGGALDPNALPSVPVQTGFTGKWDGLEEADLSCILFDETFTAVYTPLSSAQASAELRSVGHPVALLEGSFASDDTLHLTPDENQPELAAGETWLETWQLNLPASVEWEENQLYRLHYLPPEGSSNVTLYLHSASGWRETESTADGSYLVVDLCPGDDLLAAAERPSTAFPATLLGIGAALVLLALLRLRRRKKRRACQAAKPAEAGRPAEPGA
ncbi:MAG: hypothetical protein ACI4OL_03810 [Gemmiger sp.]